MKTPLEDVDFLARSPHRVRVLEALHEGPMTRVGLRETTDISQPTLGRILDDLVERRWARRRGQTYELTSLGAVLAEEFGDLLATVGTMQRLEELAPWLPEFPFDLRRLADATVTLPDGPEAFEHLRRAEQRVDDAERVMGVIPTGTRAQIERQHRRSVGGGQRYVGVLSAALAEQARSDPELARLTREMIDSGNVEFHEYDGEFPCGVGLADDRAVIAPFDEHGFPRGIVESEDGTVRAWVEETLQGYIDVSEPLTVASLSA